MKIAKWIQAGLLCVVLMLVAAAILEGFGRQLVQDLTQRLIVGGGMLAFWLVYFFGFGRRDTLGHEGAA